MKKNILSIAGLLLLSFTGWSQTYKYSNEFLAIGVGARSFAMGHSVTASVNDETAIYWNPSTMAGQSNPITAGLMHAEYFAGLSQFDYVGATIAIDKASTFGAAFIRFGVDDIPDTRDLIDSDGNIQFDRIRSFSSSDYAVYFSYARKMPIENLRVGGNVKIIRRVVGQFASAWGFGLDASAHYTYNNWQFAAVLRDISTTFNTWSYNLAELEEIYTATDNELPNGSSEITLPRIILGASYYQQFKDKFGVLGEINMDITTDGKRNVLLPGDPFSVDPHMGLELDYKRKVFIRAGVHNMQKEPDFEKEEILTLQPNMGLGVQLRNVRIDYALTDIGNVSAAGYSHVFSFSLAIQNLPKK